MDDHSEPRWRIGQVSARTGLTIRTLRYYEELACSGRPGGLSVGIGSMRTKISAASTGSHFFVSWACRSQTSPGNWKTRRTSCLTPSGGILGRLINGWRPSAAIGNAWSPSETP